jgi:hypothetical protein
MLGYVRWKISNYQAMEERDRGLRAARHAKKIQAAVNAAVRR